MKSTDQLQKVLENSDDIEKYLQENFGDIQGLTFSEYLNQCSENHNKTKNDVIKSSNIQTNYAYQIFDGSKLPSRDKVLDLCFSIQVSIDEANRLLKLSDHSILYPRLKRDSIIIFALEKKKNLIDTNILLNEMGEEIIQ